MILVNRYQYNPYERVEGKNGRYYKVDNDRPLPSVTTVLSKTGDKSALDNWRASIGDEEANRIVAESTKIGSKMHDNLEKYILNGVTPSGSMLERILTKLVIDRGLSNVDEVWGTEAGLFTKQLYAGTTDLIGVHKGIPAIMDFKNSRKYKKKEYITDYFLQLVAYAISHNEMFGTDIQKGVIMMACRTGDYLEFVIEGEEFRHYKRMWYDRLYQYYETYGVD